MSKVTRHYIFCDLCQDQMESEDEQIPPEWVQFVNKRGIDWNVCPECVAAILKAKAEETEMRRPEDVKIVATWTEPGPAGNRARKWCQHGQVWLPEGEGCECLPLRVEDIFPKTDAGPAGLRALAPVEVESAGDRGWPCVGDETEEPQLDAVAEEQLARDFRRICKWCHHSQAWHPVSGAPMVVCGMLGCRCPVLRGDPVFREEEEAAETTIP